IRDRNVTGVQTCALPISAASSTGRRGTRGIMILLSVVRLSGVHGAPAHHGTGHLVILVQQNQVGVTAHVQLPLGGPAHQAGGVGDRKSVVYGEWVADGAL